MWLYLSFYTVCCLFVTLIGFASWIHGSALAFWFFVISGLLLLGGFGLWLYALVYPACVASGLPESTDGLRARKLWTGICLVILFVFAFNLTFALIPLHHWLQADHHGGHVHGMSVDPLKLAAEHLGKKDRVTIFFTHDINTEGLACRFFVTPKNLKMKPGSKAKVHVRVVNPLLEQANFRMQTRVFPSEAGRFIEYDPINQDQVLTVPAQGALEWDQEIQLDSHMPTNLAHFTISSFLYGQATGQVGYQKMLAPGP